MKSNKAKRIFYSDNIPIKIEYLPLQLGKICRYKLWIKDTLVKRYGKIELDKYDIVSSIGEIIAEGLKLTYERE